ncbi:MAG: hypothetical protein R6U58_12635 [Bacteroidales bacterium]
MNNNIDKVLVTRAVISKIKEESDSAQIKARDLKEYDTPSAVITDQKDDGFNPDIVVYDNDVINLYEIELDEDTDKDKWKVLSLYANKHGGHLYLVVPDNIRDEVKKELKMAKINAGLIYFKVE